MSICKCLHRWLIPVINAPTSLEILDNRSRSRLSAHNFFFLFFSNRFLSLLRNYHRVSPWMPSNLFSTVRRNFQGTRHRRRATFWSFSARWLRVETVHLVLPWREEHHSVHAVSVSCCLTPRSQLRSYYSLSFVVPRGSGDCLCRTNPLAC